MQPQSLLGSGMIEEEGDPNEQASLLRSQGSMPTAAMSMMAPPPTANPMLAGASGALASLQGQTSNPYLRHNLEMSNSAQALQQGGARTMGYLQQNQLAQQSQMLQQQRHQERLKMREELNRQAQETRNKEAEIRLGLELFKSDDENSKRVGLQVLGKHFKEVHHIDAAATLKHSQTFKAEEKKDIDHMIMAGVPLQDVQARYPKVTPEYYQTETQLVKHPITGPLLVPRPKEDPQKSVLKEESERVKDFLGANPGFKGDPEIYNEASTAFRLKTGRELSASTLEDKPLVELVRAAADAVVTKRRKDERIEQLTEQMLLQERKELRVAAAKEQEKPNKLDEPMPPQELLYWVNKKTRLHPVANMTRKEVQKSGEYVAISPSQSKVISQAGTVQHMLSELNQIAKTNPQAIWSSNIPGAALVSKDVARVQSLMIALPSAVRLFGEVGNLAAPEQARALAALKGITSAEGMEARVQTVLDLVNKAVTGMGLDPLAIENALPMQKSGPLSNPFDQFDKSGGKK